VIDLDGLVAAVRAHPGLAAKRPLVEVARVIGGDGDDAALLPDGDGRLVLAAEAILPALVAADPRVAGAAGVVAVLNDVAASGGRPFAILDTVVAGDAETAGAVLAGLRATADLYAVPVVGGHTTIAPEAALSTFAAGRALRPLAAAHARSGDGLVLVACLEGQALAGPGGLPLFSHLRGPRRERAAADLALLADSAEAGEAWAARDVSMPGLAGSLIQLCESAGGLGCELRVDAVPVPPGLDLAAWLVTFPSYGFLLVGDPPPIVGRFAAAGLAAAAVGRLDASGVVRAVAGGKERVLWDLRAEPLAGMGAERDRRAPVT
jgi:selenophosphate synthetase-related protein